ncbi:hypothetical protein Trydic_g3986 [Trypoxylus dichotomus]
MVGKQKLAGISLVQMPNRRGEIVYPCGASAVTVDRWLSSLTLNALWGRYEWTSLTIALEMLAQCIFKSSRGRQVPPIAF